MTLPNLTESILKRHATDTSYSRGEDYFHSGAVVSVTQRQQTIEAEVEGNEVHPYRVTIELDKGGVTQAICTCPYCFEGWCKHIVATLLTCIHQPDTIEQRPTLNQLLAPLTLAQTQELVQRLVAGQPELIEAVDRYTCQLVQPDAPSTKASRPKRKTSVDPAPFKRKVREILRGAVRDWEYGREDDDIGFEMNALMDDALAFAEQGDAGNAMAVLQGITEGALKNWDEIDDYCGLTPNDVDVDFDSTWAEVLLSADLTEEEALEWQETLESWQDLDSFSLALEALRQGWTYPPLVKVLQGDPSAQRAWVGDPLEWIDELTQIRLKILGQQERYEEYLRLAKVEGHTQAYITMLGRLGRVEQAVTVAQTQMTTLTEAKALAETLLEQNQLEQALDIALKGLQLEQGDRSIAFKFALWTSELAEGLGQASAALDSRIIAFKLQPSFKDYQKIQDMAEADWSAIQEPLLQHLRKIQVWGVEEAQVDIFLHEGLVEDAIAIVSDLRSYHGTLILRVMDAAIATHSQWVIDNARPRAESIMDSGKAQYYYNAVEWLQRVKAAYQEMGQKADWSRYYEKLVSQHCRKRKLMGLMKSHHL